MRDKWEYDGSTINLPGGDKPAERYAAWQEYVTVTLPAKGEEGWELVTVVQPATDTYIHYFKRWLQED